LASGAVVVPASRNLDLSYWIFGLMLSDEKVRDNARRAADLRVRLFGCDQHCRRAYQVDRRGA
jgi:hypothetical protein